MDDIQQARVESTPRAYTSAGAWLALAAGIFMIVSRDFPDLWVACAGIICAMLAIVVLAHHRKQKYLALLILILLVLGTVFYTHFVRVTGCSKSGEVISNTHGIQLALERYATDNSGFYPLTITPLRDEGYMPTLPRNPYRRLPVYIQQNLTREQREEADSMQPLGQEYTPINLKPYSPDLTGNFCYLPRIETGSDGCLYVRDYSLLSIGKEYKEPTWSKPGRSIHVVLCYYNGQAGYFKDWY